MKFIFGPVNSRRLGRSLGIDLFIQKICNLNCIYCEVGTTPTHVCQRAAYTSTQEILDEISVYASDADRMRSVDVVTVTAKGEPTLHLGLEKILQHIKRTTSKPLAVLTNGTTLMLEEVRRALNVADIVIPSLDSAREESFRKIDRPDASLHLQEIVDGLTVFSREFSGELWLEILFSLGINDHAEDIDALLTVISRMQVSRIQLNTVVRPPAESFALPLALEQLAAIAEIFHQQLGIPVDLPKLQLDERQQNQTTHVVHEPQSHLAEGVLAEIMRMVSRRPCTAVDIDRSFNLGGPDMIRQLLEPFVLSGILKKRDHGHEQFYQNARSVQSGS